MAPARPAFQHLIDLPIRFPTCKWVSFQRELLKANKGAAHQWRICFKRDPARLWVRYGPWLEPDENFSVAWRTPGVLFKQIAHTIPADQAVLDGELVCLDADGRSNFYNLLFRREWPSFFAFDLLALEGDDLRALSLIRRKRRLRTLLPTAESRLLYVDHIEGRGCDFFQAVCEHDCQGVVGKWRQGRYHMDGASTSWVKVKNPSYPQRTRRRELFEHRRDVRQRSRSRWQAPVLALA
jgi:hypothetical protein